MEKQSCVLSNNNIRRLKPVRYEEKNIFKKTCKVIYAAQTNRVN